MATVLWLYVLAILDAAFSGICAASGRNALIEKRDYFLRSMWHGVLVGQLVALSAFVLIGVVILTSSDRPSTIEQMLAVGDRLVVIYTVYASVVLVTFAIRAIPSVDIRSITSTVGFGPLTLLRPFVIVIGAIYGLMIQPSLPVVLVTICIALMMIPFRVLLNYVFERMDCYIHPLGSQSSSVSP